MTGPPSPARGPRPRSPPSPTSTTTGSRDGYPQAVDFEGKTPDQAASIP
jgi:hypothetical protein